MTKAELVTQIASKANIAKISAERSLNAVLEAVREVLVEEGRLTLTGLGTFYVASRKERQGHNPRTGAALTIAASKVVRFRPGKSLQDAVK